MTALALHRRLIKMVYYSENGTVDEEIRTHAGMA